MTNTELQKISKRMSYLLRHDPEDLEMDENGYVSTVDMIEKLDVTLEDLAEVVVTNDKQRFEFKDQQKLIRAAQGHSIKGIDLKLKPVKPSGFLYHGTSKESHKQIIKSGGISKMNRQHVHLSGDLDTAYNVGKRHSKHEEPWIMMIDASKMYRDGFVFYKSANGVWLTDSVPKKYIIKTYQ